MIEEYKTAIIDKIERLITLIGKYDCVKEVSFFNGDVKIEFIEEVDIEGQNVFNTFIYGGAIKKSESKDNIKEQYFEIPAIGDNY